MTGVKCNMVVPAGVAEMYALLREDGTRYIDGDGVPELSGDLLLADCAWPHAVCWQAVLEDNSWHNEVTSQRFHVVSELAISFNRLGTTQTQPHTKESDRLDSLVERIMDWPDDRPRTTDHYDDDGYCETCSTLWELCGGTDNGSSSSMHSQYLFVSVTVLAMAKLNRSLALFRAQSQLKSATENVARLAAEVQEREAAVAADDGKAAEDVGHIIQQAGPGRQD